MDDLSRVTSLRHRIPRNHKQQDLNPSERLSGGRPPFVSDTRDEEGVGVEGWRSRDTAFPGGMAGKVCTLFVSGLLVSVAEFFIVVSQGGCCGEGTATLQRCSSPWDTISVHLFFCIFFFYTRLEHAGRPSHIVHVILTYVNRYSF